MKTVIFAVFAAMLTLTACTQEKVGFNTLESARAQVNENVTLVAQDFRAKNNMAEYDIYVRGDSTQSSECPQGDGWATIDFKSRSNGGKSTYKCSTVSVNLSCIEANEFKTKSYASEEGRCNRELPFPVVKIAK